MTHLRNMLQIQRINTMRERMRRQLHLASCESCRARQAGESPLQGLIVKLLGGGEDEPAPTHSAPAKAH